MALYTHLSTLTETLSSLVTGSTCTSEAVQRWPTERSGREGAFELCVDEAWNSLPACEFSVAFPAGSANTDVPGMNPSSRSVGVGWGRIL